MKDSNQARYSHKSHPSPWAVWLTLARASNLPTVWSNVLLALVITHRENCLAYLPQWLGLSLAASLIYGAGCAWNDAFDAEWDAQHRPERPIPSGKISRNAVWCGGAVGLLLGTMGFLAVAFFSKVALLPVVLSLAGLFGSIVVYDLIHKKTVWAVLPMAACRVLLIVTVAYALSGENHEGLGCALAVGFYIVMITWLARMETAPQKARRGGLLAMMAVIFLAMLSVRMAFYPKGDWLPILGLFIFFTWVSVGVWWHKTNMPQQISALVSFLLASLCVLDATMMLTSSFLGAGISFLGYFLARWWQRSHAAT